MKREDEMAKQLRLKVGDLTLTYNEEQTQEILQSLVEFLTDEDQRVFVLTLCHQEQIDKIGARAFPHCGTHLPIC